MPTYKLPLLVSTLLALCLTARATNYTAASLSSTDVQTAMNSASASGDTVTLPAGSANWTTGVTWTAPANAQLIGAGTTATGGGDQTTIVDNIASDSRLVQITINTTGTFRMTGITFQSGTGSLKDGGTIKISGRGDARIDHCHFLMTVANNYKAILFTGGVFGVMDHCILDFTGLNTLFFSNGRQGGGASGDYEWTQSTNFGGSDYFFIEDNIINGTVGSGTYNTRVFDGFTSSKIVVRFNTVVQAVLSETHATGHSGDDRGLRSQEIYGNAVTSTLVYNPNYTAVDLSNGTGLVWGNTWNQVYKNIYVFKITRRNSATYAQSPPPTRWGYAGPTPLATGTVDVTGTAVTWASGDTFDTNWPTGTMIYIVGMTAEGVAGQSPNDGPSGGISAVGSTTSITLANGGHTGAPLTGAAYTVGSAWDGNTDAVGYPCLDQPGRGVGDLLTGVFPNKVNDTTGTVAWPNQALEPIYLWNNSGSIVSGWGGSTISNQTVGRVVADRDYYASATGIQTSPTTPFDGTSGTGWGTLANRPTTCTTGVAYFATDAGGWNQSSTNPYGVQQNGANGVLYKATATDTWTAYYTPYTYPHPLQGVVTAVNTPAPTSQRSMHHGGL